MLAQLSQLEEERYTLQGSLLDFTRVFYELCTGREFLMPNPIGREPHPITIMRELTDVFHMKTQYLLINIPPGHFKSTMLSCFVAWAMSHYPDSQFMYVSYAKGLAERHTGFIKQIMSHPYYAKLFGVQIKQDTTAKGYFRTENGGSVMAFGSGGGITGQDAGLPGVDRFSGCWIIDDPHKPDEVHSDTIRESIIDNYNQTIKPRGRSPIVPGLFIGQRLHEADLAGYILDGRDGFDWRAVVLKAVDEAGNILCPEVISKERLLIEQETNPYVYSAQYQQDPQPAGGGIFKPEWFLLLNDEPKFVCTFITADTAETARDYNDATVFSFWGLYKPVVLGSEVDSYSLHWIDCLEVRVEPKDLESEFMHFYAACLRHRVKPKHIAIEKKSTGATLSSVLGTFPGMNIINVERTKASGSKTARFFEAQPYVASRCITFTRYAKHYDDCVEHCRKITSNNTHRFDDIADTMYDAIKLALIDNFFDNLTQIKPEREAMLKSFTNDLNSRMAAQRQRNNTGII